MDALRKAIELCGGQTALAARLGIKQSAIGNWLARGSVPPIRVIAIEQATGGKVRCHDLRPDLYPRPTRRKSP